MWLALLAFHLIGLVGFNLVLRQSVHAKIDRFTLATIAQTGIAVPAAVLLLIAPPHLQTFSGTVWLYLAATVGLTIALQTTNAKALQYLEASVFAVIYNLRIILTTVLGLLFLHETFVWLRFAGGMLILLAIFIVRQRGSRSLRLHGLAWGLAAAVALSFLNLFEKLLIIHVGFLNYFPIESVVAAIIMWGYLLSYNKTFEPKLLRQSNMLQLMVLRAISAYGFSGALAAGALVSVANYISGMNVIFIVVLGAILLKEDDYLKRKALAVTVALVGLTIILYA